MKIIFGCTISLGVQRESRMGCRGNCCIIKPNADEDSHPPSKTDAPLHFVNLVSTTLKQEWTVSHINGLKLKYHNSMFKGNQEWPATSGAGMQL